MRQRGEGDEQQARIHNTACVEERKAGEDRGKWEPDIMVYKETRDGMSRRRHDPVKGKG